MTASTTGRSRRGNKKAKFGRSKEKRSDCKLLVLALCVNTAGFPRYSEILEGNTSDPKSLPEMVKRPSKQAREIYRKLGYKEAPFRKMKICRSQLSRPKIALQQKE